MMIEILNVIATIVLGLCAGSLLTEAMILVPYWRRLKSKDFLDLHHSLGPHLFRYFAPLTVGTVILTNLVAAVDQGRNLAWLASAILCLISLGIFFVYFRRANNSFAEKTISEDQLPSELKKWASWHWARTIVMIAALGFSVIGHTNSF